MTGLLRRRQLTGQLWPEDATWLWAFTADAQLTTEFGLYVQGKAVPPSRTYQYQTWGFTYTRCDAIEVTTAGKSYDELMSEMAGRCTKLRGAYASTYLLAQGLTCQALHGW